MKRTFYLALLLLVLGVFAYGLHLYKPALYRSKLSAPVAITLPVTTVPESPPQQIEATPLNLALPKTEMLMDHTVALPDNPQRLHKLFEPNPKDAAMSVGGRLLVDENPKPDAGMLDKVKGAEIGITIKTP